MTNKPDLGEDISPTKGQQMGAGPSVTRLSVSPEELKDKFKKYHEEQSKSSFQRGMNIGILGCIATMTMLAVAPAAIPEALAVGGAFTVAALVNTVKSIIHDDKSQDSHVNYILETGEGISFAKKQGLTH